MCVVSLHVVSLVSVFSLLVHHVNDALLTIRVLTGDTRLWRVAYVRGIIPTLLHIIELFDRERHLHLHFYKTRSVLFVLSTIS